MPSNVVTSEVINLPSGFTQYNTMVISCKTYVDTTPGYYVEKDYKIKATTIEISNMEEIAGNAYVLWIMR